MSDDTANPNAATDKPEHVSIEPAPPAPPPASVKPGSPAHMHHLHDHAAAVHAAAGHIHRLANTLINHVDDTGKDVAAKLKQATAQMNLSVANMLILPKDMPPNTGGAAQPLEHASDDATVET